MPLSSHNSHSRLPTPGSSALSAVGTSTLPPSWSLSTTLRIHCYSTSLKFGHSTAEPNPTVVGPPQILMLLLHNTTDIYWLLLSCANSTVPSSAWLFITLERSNQLYWELPSFHPVLETGVKKILPLQAPFLSVFYPLSSTFIMTRARLGLSTRLMKLQLLWYNQCTVTIT